MAKKTAAKIGIQTVAKIRKLDIKQSAYDLRFKDMDLKADDIRKLAVLMKSKDHLILRIGEDIVTPALLNNCNMGQLCDDPKFKSIQLTDEAIVSIHGHIKKEEMVDVVIEQDTEGMFDFGDDAEEVEEK